MTFCYQTKTDPLFDHRNCFVWPIGIPNDVQLDTEVIKELINLAMEDGERIARRRDNGLPLQVAWLKVRFDSQWMTFGHTNDNRFLSYRIDEQVGVDNRQVSETGM